MRGTPNGGADLPPYAAGSVGHLFGTFSIGCLLSRTEHAQSVGAAQGSSISGPHSNAKGWISGGHLLEASRLGRSDRLLQTVSDRRLEGIVESPCVALPMDVRSEEMCGDPRLRSRCRNGAGSKKFGWQ